MVLEATVILLDNSEFMRNGDLLPTRFLAQADAVGLLAETKTSMNPENTVGLMTIAGKGPEVLVTATQDGGKILSCLHEVKISGETDLVHGIQVAQLALKHRQNKNQRQRIVAFIGSPLKEDEKTLVRLGKKLKKNNVSVDVVSFGESEDNEDRLSKFVDAVGGGDNNHLLSVPSGPHILLSDAIMNSAILHGEGFGAAEGGAGEGGAGAGPSQYEFGVDPSLDPELAMALRMSMEEERARQAASAPSTSAAPAESLPSVPESAEPKSAAAGGAGDDEDALLQQALALSAQKEDVEMEDAKKAEKAAESGPQVVTRAEQAEQAGEDEEMDEEAAIAKAIEMSMRQEEQGKDGK